MGPPARWSRCSSSFIIPRKLSCSVLSSRTSMPCVSVARQASRRVTRMSESSQVLVQRQLDAYNAHDLDAFLSSYTGDAVYSRHPTGEVVMSGSDDIRKAFGDVFTQNPHAHVSIVNRMQIGNFVIDMEELTGRADGATLYLVAIYEVIDGLIHRVWTLRG